MSVLSELLTDLEASGAGCFSEKTPSGDTIHCWVSPPPELIERIKAYFDSYREASDD